MSRLWSVCALCALCVPSMASAQVYEKEEWAHPYGSWSMGAQLGGSYAGADSIGAESAQGFVGIDATAALGAHTPGLAVQPAGHGTPFFIRDPYFGAALAIDGSATLSPSSDEVDTVALLQGRVGVEVAAGWVDGSYSEDYQRPVSFDDHYWRSEDGSIRRTLSVHVPGLLSLEEPEEQVQMNLGRVRFDRRELFAASGVQVTPDEHIGDDYQWQVSGFELTTPVLEDIMFQARVAAYDIERFVVPSDYSDANPLARVYDRGTVIAGRNRLDLVDFQTAADGITVTRASFGYSFISPAYLDAEDEGDARYAWRFGIGQGGGAPYVGETAWNVELASFHRLDPSGTAVDAGNQVRVDAAHGVAPGLVASASLVGIGAERVMVSELADRASLPMLEGDLIYMGRAEAELAYDLNDHVVVSLDGWAERSDRADVSMGARRRGIIDLETTFGANLSLSASFGSDEEYERVRMQ